MTAGPVAITLYAAAPDKPPDGTACNGCGACCAAAPCPLSRVLLGHRGGACPALAWSGADNRYYCGLVTQPRKSLGWLPGPLAPPFARLARRWIAAGRGCDFAAEVESPGSG